jgi:hypothetical protein
MTPSGQHLSYCLRSEIARERSHLVYTQVGKGFYPSAPLDEDNRQLHYPRRIWRLMFSFFYSDQVLSG